MFLYYGLVAILVLIDQFVKFWTVNSFDLNTGSEFIPNILSFFYIQNDGAAWGIFSGQMWLFAIITLVVIGMLIVMLHRDAKDSKFLAWAISFILAGAIGNFIDRMRLGYVVDMFKLEFMEFPIFNVADICLTIGVILMFIYLFFIEGKEESKKNEPK